MPATIVRRYRNGGWFASVVIMPLLGLFATNLVYRPTSPWFGLACVLVTLAWVPAVWCLTVSAEVPQAAWNGFGERSRLRASARYLQFAWVVWACALLLPQVWKTIPVGAVPTARGILELAVIGILAAVVVLSVQLRKLAEWVRDDVAMRLFNGAAWFMPLAYVIWSTGWYPPRFGLIFRGLMAGVVFGFGLAVLSLTWSLQTAVLHSMAAAVRHQERRERQTKQQAEVLAALPEPPPPLATPADQRGGDSVSGSAVDPYNIEPDDHRTHST